MVPDIKKVEEDILEKSPEKSIRIYDIEHSIYKQIGRKEDIINFESKKKHKKIRGIKYDVNASTNITTTTKPVENNCKEEQRSRSPNFRIKRDSINYSMVIPSIRNINGYSDELKQNVQDLLKSAILSTEDPTASRRSMSYKKSSVHSSKSTSRKRMKFTSKKLTNPFPQQESIHKVRAKSYNKIYLKKVNKTHNEDVFEQPDINYAKQNNNTNYNRLTLLKTKKKTNDKLNMKTHSIFNKKGSTVTN